jgi:hypothetical protein
VSSKLDHTGAAVPLQGTRGGLLWSRHLHYANLTLQAMLPPPSGDGFALGGLGGAGAAAAGVYDPFTAQAWLQRDARSEGAAERQRGHGRRLSVRGRKLSDAAFTAKNGHAEADNDDGADEKNPVARTGSSNSAAAAAAAERQLYDWEVGCNQAAIMQTAATEYPAADAGGGAAGGPAVSLFQRVAVSHACDPASYAPVDAPPAAAAKPACSAAVLLFLPGTSVPTQDALQCAAGFNAPGGGDDGAGGHASCVFDAARGTLTVQATSNAALEAALSTAAYRCTAGAHCAQGKRTLLLMPLPSCAAADAFTPPLWYPLPRPDQVLPVPVASITVTPPAGSAAGACPSAQFAPSTDGYGDAGQQAFPLYAPAWVAAPFALASAAPGAAGGPMTVHAEEVASLTTGTHPPAAGAYAGAATEQRLRVAGTAGAATDALHNVVLTSTGSRGLRLLVAWVDGPTCASPMLLQPVVMEGGDGGVCCDCMPRLGFPDCAASGNGDGLSLSLPPALAGATAVGAGAAASDSVTCAGADGTVSAGADAAAPAAGGRSGTAATVVGSFSAVAASNFIQPPAMEAALKAGGQLVGVRVLPVAPAVVAPTWPAQRQSSGAPPLPFPCQATTANAYFPIAAARVAFGAGFVAGRDALLFNSGAVAPVITVGGVKLTHAFTFDAATGRGWLIISSLAPEAAVVWGPTPPGDADSLRFDAAAAATAGPGGASAAPTFGVPADYVSALSKGLLYVRLSEPVAGVSAATYSAADCSTASAASPSSASAAAAQRRRLEGAAAGLSGSSPGVDAAYRRASRSLAAGAGDVSISITLLDSGPISGADSCSSPPLTVTVSAAAAASAASVGAASFHANDMSASAVGDVGWTCGSVCAAGAAPVPREPGACPNLVTHWEAPGAGVADGSPAADVGRPAGPAPVGSTPNRPGGSPVTNAASGRHGLSWLRALTSAGGWSVGGGAFRRPWVQQPSVACSRLSCWRGRRLSPRPRVSAAVTTHWCAGLGRALASIRGPWLHARVRSLVLYSASQFGFLRRVAQAAGADAVPRLLSMPQPPAKGTPIWPTRRCLSCLLWV